DRYEYFKPLETGESDTDRVRRLVPAAAVHPPLMHFRHPVAPMLAARMEGKSIPPARDIAALRDAPRQPGHSLLLETFGSPFSPLNESELQLTLVKALAVPAVLVSSSAVGAIGRTRPCLQGLAAHGVRPAAVVLVGSADSFAAEQIATHWPSARVFSLRPPAAWDVEGVAAAAREQRPVLDALRACVESAAAPRV